MFHVNKFIAEAVTQRNASMFREDLTANQELLTREIAGKKVLVIGGAGTIGSSYIRALLPFRPAKLVVVDLSENGLTELTRDLRSTFGMYVPPDYRTYPLSFADPIFEKFSGRKTVLISSQTFRPTSMSAARRMSIPYRRCWKTMC